VNLFIAKGIDSRTDFNGIIKSVLPMFALLVVVLLLVTFIPALSTGLIHLLAGA
jgi:TRAP-type C4-dicarboxylate transport system permease large subunit